MLGHLFYELVNITKILTQKSVFVLKHILSTQNCVGKGRGRGGEGREEETRERERGKEPEKEGGGKRGEGGKDNIDQYQKLS